MRVIFEKHVNLYYFGCLYSSCLEKHVVSFWTSMCLVFLVKAYGFILVIGLKFFSKSTWFHSACIPDIYSWKSLKFCMFMEIYYLLCFGKQRWDLYHLKMGDKYCLLLLKLQILLHTVIRISIFLCYQAHKLKTEHCTSL